MQKVPWLWVPVSNERAWQALAAGAASQLAAESKCTLEDDVWKFRTASGVSAIPVVIFLSVYFVLVSNCFQFQALSGCKGCARAAGKMQEGFLYP